MTEPAAQGTLLIVDDELGGREALEGLLLNQGYRLEFASNGAEALQRVRDVLPDLILLDVMMPGMDGFSVCRKVRADTHSAEIPVLLVTALDDRDTRLEGISAGADDFISKPFDRAELRLRVKTITRIGRYRRLLTERARFHTVVEHAVDGYLTVKDGGEISYANQAARGFLNLPERAPDDGWGHFLEVARRQYRLEPDSVWKDEELRVAGRHYLVRPETSNASAFWLGVTSIDQPGNGTGERLLRLHDVTEEIDLHRDHHSFHRMIAHKLRTPLHGIVSILDLMRTEMAGSEFTDLLTLAGESAERLNRGVEDILNFASVSESSTAGTFPLAQFSDLVSRLQGELEIRSLETRLEPALLAESLTLSPLQFEVICRELFENARKFHPKNNPALRLTAAIGSDRCMHLEILDNGMHLAPDQLAQVWKPYYQGEKRVTGEVAGMGLGLSMVRSIVLAKDGNIHLRNRPDGPGIEVSMDLPLVRK